MSRRAVAGRAVLRLRCLKLPLGSLVDLATVLYAEVSDVILQIHRLKLQHLTYLCVNDG